VGLLTCTNVLALKPVLVEGVMREFSRMTHIIFTVLVHGMTYPLSMHRVIAQFYRFLHIFKCCMLVGQLCLKIVSTCLSGRVIGVSFIGLRADRGHEDDPRFLSHLLNIMTCHLICICDTLFNVYDSSVETGLDIHPYGFSSLAVAVKAIRTRHTPNPSPKRNILV
jgi:hypothetical protein